LKDHPSPLLLGASDLTLFPLHQLVDFKSALMVSETSASEDGSLEERLRGGKPSSRSGRPRTPDDARDIFLVRFLELSGVPEID
jgi:hypothetical protein